jgi:hypothetical protein
MSTNTPNPSPARGPTTDSLDTLTIVVEGNGDTTIRPVDPKHLPHIREIKRLLEERERKRREQGEPPPLPPPAPPLSPGE